MNAYDGDSVDAYMRCILEQDLLPFESDNALTLLTTLTTLLPGEFPHERTFVRVNKYKQKLTGAVVVTGVTFFAFKDGKEGLSLTIPRVDLHGIKTAFEGFFSTLGKGYTLGDL